MDDMNIPSNSNVSREAPVVKEPAHIERPPRVKRGFFSRIADFFSRRDPVEIANDIWENEIKPGGKQMLSNTLHKMVDGVVYEVGEKKRGSYTETTRGGSMIQYDKASTRGESSGATTAKERTPSQIRPEDVEFETEEQAKEKLEIIDEIIGRNGFLRVSEFFDICEYKCPYTYNNFGWESFMDVRIMKKLNGKYRFYGIPKAIRV